MSNWKIKFTMCIIPHQTLIYLLQLYKVNFISLEKAMAPHSILLPGKSHGQRILVGCSPWGCWVGHDWATSLSLFTFMHWRRKWQPTLVFLLGESQGWGSLVGSHLWGRAESDTTEVTQQQQLHISQYNICVYSSNWRTQVWTMWIHLHTDFLKIIHMTLLHDLQFVESTDVEPLTLRTDWKVTGGILTLHWSGGPMTTIALLFKGQLYLIFKTKN